MNSIRVRKRIGYGWYADMESLPGTPPVGRGDNPAEAVGNLIRNLAVESETWGKYGAGFMVHVVEVSDVQAD